ncbi:MAG TPA: helix-turn-helix domain-containing protein [Solirubrobacteraceae bacterium]|nr:helix-turn-helix domain-containing protein [Solirubrobacteraceae bacterium]
MDKADLQDFLDRGLSLEQIGKRVGRHPSTVGYWLKKHGLEAVNKEKHAARGGLSRDEVERLIAAGAPIRAIAAELGVSQRTVRHWMMRFGLRTRGRFGRETREARKKGRAIIRRECRHHGVTDFWLEGRGYYRCLRCRREAVTRRRRKMKAILVAEAGGRCKLCGYSRYVGALEFHHIDPADKRFALSTDGVTRSLARARVEAQKCVLLCANCHAEVEGGLAAVG